MNDKILMPSAKENNNNLNVQESEAQVQNFAFESVPQKKYTQKKVS